MGPELYTLLEKDASAAFYRSYSSLFLGYLDRKPPQKLVSDLDLSGHLIFQMIMHRDRIEDDKQNDWSCVLQLQLESTKLLCRYFADGHSFWQAYSKIDRLFNCRKDLENNCKLFPTWSSYVSLALSRSIYASLAIEAYFHLGYLSDTSRNLLLKSHDRFVEAYQLYDDCSDLIQDNERGQFNWALYLAEQRDVKITAFYHSSLFEELLSQIISGVNAAADYLHLFPDSGYATVLQQLKHAASRMYRSHIE